MSSRAAWVVLGLWGAGVACKIEPIEELELAEHTPLELPGTVQPLSNEPTDDARAAAHWDEALQRHLAFVTSAELGGRRPGTPGADLTAGHVISVLQAAGLSPSGPDLGWTQAVGVRVVWTEGLSLSVQPPAPAEGSAPSPQQFEEGLWLQRRGAAGEATLRLRIDGQAERPPDAQEPTEQAPTEQARLRLRLLDAAAVATGASPLTAYREAFDTAWRDGVDVALLPIPRDDTAIAAAGRWREPDVQSLLLGRDPPAALELQGFVAPEVHAALQRARTTPGATVELAYEATERWFEDESVIGRLAGAVHPEQVVLVTTHWDAGGLSSPLPEGGATDEAGSLAVLLAVAETAGRWRSAGRRPERSIVFLAEAAGSLGHRGIARFIEASGIRPANVVAVVVLERLGGTGAELLAIDGSRSTLGPQLATLDPATRSIDAGDEPHGHAPFLALGVPAVTLTRPPPSGLDGPIPAPSVDTLRRDAELTLRLAWDLAEQPEPPRVVTEEEQAPARPPASPPAPG